jgi:hypothetical protein
VTTPIDLNAPPSKHKVSMEPEEDPKVLDARLREEALDARLRRVKEALLFLAALAGVVLLIGTCAWIAFGMPAERLGMAPPTPEDRKWAMSVLTAALGGLIGYLVRK